MLGFEKGGEAEIKPTRGKRTAQGWQPREGAPLPRQASDLRLWSGWFDPEEPPGFGCASVSKEKRTSLKSRDCPEIERLRNRLENQKRLSTTSPLSLKAVTQSPMTPGWGSGSLCDIWKVQ